MSEATQTPDLSYTAGVAAERRSRLFKETANATMSRIALGLAYVLRPKRIGGLPGLAWVMARDVLELGSQPPSPETALTAPDGLVGIVRDLSAPTLLAGYRSGLYPFCHIGPMKWWAPRERSLLAPEAMHIGKNLRRLLRKTDFTVTFDRAFDEVVAACAEPRPGRPRLTWITPRIMNAFAALFDEGHAHSFEVWSPDGQLVGGGYGLAVGRVFFTESQFSRVRDGSKVGFASLNHHLARWSYVANDGKGHVLNLAEFGFNPMPRADFNALLARYAHGGGRAGRWAMEIPLAETASAGQAGRADAPQPLRVRART